MMKFYASALVIAAMLCGTVVADSGVVSDSTLRAMGLSGMQVMTDAEALAVRGKGWDGGGYLEVPNGHHSKPWSLAGGASFAAVGDDDVEAGTVNFYLAEGEYAASGTNFSEAGATWTDILSVDINGIVKTETQVESIHVFAAGASSAMSF